MTNLAKLSPEDKAWIVTLLATHANHLPQILMIVSLPSVILSKF